MRKTIIIPAAALLGSISVTALAQSSGGQAVPAPIGTHELQHAVSHGDAISQPGGLYRLANGYLSCPDTLPITNWQPNLLRSCTYIKELR
jgi:hypothetical protein